MTNGETFEFVNRVVGTNIPPEYIPSCEKGAKDAMDKGPLTGHPAQVCKPSQAGIPQSLQIDVFIVCLFFYLLIGHSGGIDRWYSTCCR